MNRQRLWPRIVIVLYTLASMPFVISAVVLFGRFASLSSQGNSLKAIPLLSSGLFAFGIGIGLVGIGTAFGCSDLGNRKLGAAITLFGSAHMFLGLFLEPTIFRSIKNNSLAVTIPTLLWLAAIIVALQSYKSTKHQAQSSTTSEERQPRSRS